MDDGFGAKTFRIRDREPVVVVVGVGDEADFHRRVILPQRTRSAQRKIGNGQGAQD